MSYRNRPVPQGVVAAAEDVEWLMERGRDFIQRQCSSLGPYNHQEAYAALMNTYVSNALRYITKEA